MQTSTESVVINDITLYTFRWADWALGNASVDAAEAEAYWVTGPSGVLNQSSCEWHAPILLTRPNFYGASTSLWDAIDGLDEPDQSRDDVHLNVEPYTGVTMDFAWPVRGAVRLYQGVQSALPYSMTVRCSWQSIYLKR